MSQPPAEGAISATVEGPVGTISMGGSEDRSRLDIEMGREMARTLDWFAKESQVRVLIFRAENRELPQGRAFHPEDVELEPRPRVSEKTRREVLNELDALNQSLLRFRALSYPTIAAVDGFVAGVGYSLALACDLRIASEGARFLFGYGSIGAIPDGGVTQSLADAVGPARALVLLFEDKLMRAEQAKEEGLVDYVVPQAELWEAASKRAKILASKPPHYLAAVKRLLRHQTDRGLEDQLSRERAEWEIALETEDLARGITAHLEGRTAVFEGR